jgi:hypothetical protein
MSGLIFIAVCAANSLPAGTNFAPEQYVYKIIVSDGSREIRQTGFRLRGVRGIYTALHGVTKSAHGWRITAEGPIGQILTEPLRIHKVDVSRDLALLISEELAGQNAEGLEPGRDVFPEANTKVALAGFPYGASYNTDLLRVSKSRTLLKTMIPDELIPAMVKRSSPDLNLSVIKLAVDVGGVGPGNSGSPIMADTKVVAMFNGGLDKGNRGLGWAIPLDKAEWSDPVEATLSSLDSKEISPLLSSMVIDVTDPGRIRLNKFTSAMKLMAMHARTGFDGIKGSKYDGTRFKALFDFPESDDTPLMVPNDYLSVLIDSKSLEELVEVTNLLVYSVSTAFPDPDWYSSEGKVRVESNTIRSHLRENDKVDFRFRINAIADDQGRFYVYVSVSKVTPKRRSIRSRCEN